MTTAPAGPFSRQRPQRGETTRERLPQGAIRIPRPRAVVGYYSDRIERTIALERPLLMGVDEHPYPERLNYQAVDLTEQLDLFAALRRHVALILRSQPPEAWQRTAIHSETGVVSLRQLVFQPVRHVQHHLPFIAEKRAAMRG